MTGREGPCWEGEQQAQDGAWQGRGGDAGQPTTPVDEAGPASQQEHPPVWMSLCRSKLPMLLKIRPQISHG